MSDAPEGGGAPPETVNLDPRECPTCKKLVAAQTDQGVSVDVNGECIACWGPRLEEAGDQAGIEERYNKIVAEAVRRGWMKPPGDGASAAGMPGDLGQKIDWLIQAEQQRQEEHEMMKRAVLHILARLYSPTPGGVHPEVWAWLGVASTEEVKREEPTGLVAADAFGNIIGAVKGGKLH